MAIICDGVGGLDKGEVASGFVTGNIKHYFDKLDRTKKINFSILKKTVSRIIYTCHEALPDCATTICLLIIYGRKGFIVSCGDSRAYIGHKKLSQITFDDLDSSGRLTSTIGFGQYKKPKFKNFNLYFNDTLLICSDGFYRKNEVSIISNPFSSCFDDFSLKKQLENMYATAVNKGEKDNASAIVICLRKGE